MIPADGRSGPAGSGAVGASGDPGALIGFVLRHRLLVVLAWLALTVAGG